MLSVLAVICPPLAVLLADSPSRAATNFGLTLMLYVPGVIDALSVVDRRRTGQQYLSVMRAMERRGV